MTSFISAEEAQANIGWWVVDATNVPVGRLATEVASVIRGKNKTNFTPHVNGGDCVVVINADKVVLTGKKADQKLYRWHTGYMGGLVEVKGSDMLKDHPERVVERAVHGMLPSGILGHRMLGRLKVYRGSEHPHSAQMPKELKVGRQKKS